MCQINKFGMFHIKETTVKLPDHKPDIKNKEVFSFVAEKNTPLTLNIKKANKKMSYTKKYI